MRQVPASSSLRNFTPVLPALLLGLGTAIASTSCGSDDPSRRPGRDRDDSGVDAGTGGRGSGGRSSGGASSGGAKADGGSPSTGGATADGGSTGDGGDASVGDGGDASVGPEGGAVDAAPDAPPLECAANTGNCDKVADNGCEENLTSSAQHCGECERSCASIGATCSQSVCGAGTLFTGLPFGSDNSGARSWGFDGTAAYHIGFNSYAVRRFPADGSASSTVWSASAAGGTESLAFVSGNVVWSQRGAPPAVLSKSPTAPAATVPTLLFTPEYTPTFLTVQGANLYWMSGDYQSGDPAGYVYSRPIAAASTEPGTRIVTTNQGNHGAVVGFTATTDALYWVTSAGPDPVPYAIRTAPLAGGAVTAVPGGAIQGGFTTVHTTLRPVGNTLYFARNVDSSFLNGIYRFRVGDAAPTQLVSEEDVMTFVVDANYFYYVVMNKTGVYKAPIAGGQGTLIASAYGSEIVGQDQFHLYLAQPTCCATTIVKVLK